jgi:hypothetical protein
MDSTEAIKQIKELGDRSKLALPIFEIKALLGQGQPMK